MLLGFDIGTTTSKGILINDDGTVAAYAETQHTVSRPHPGWAEQDADEVWLKDFCTLSKRLQELAQCCSHDIKAVGISGIFPVLVPVDKRGKALRKGILYGIDTRALEEISLLEKETGKSGTMSTQTIAPKILWLKRNEPEIFAKTQYFLSTTAYITYKLTGTCAIDHGQADLGGAPYDSENEKWDTEMLCCLGIFEDQLPPLKWGYEIAGYIHEEGSRQSGLAVGTPIVAGTGDHFAEVYGIGGIKAGRANISYGTTFGMDLCTEQKHVEGVNTSKSCCPGLYLTGGGMATGGSAALWAKDILQIPGGNDFSNMEAEAAKIPAGCDGLVCLPYFNGERYPFYDPQAKAMFFGLTNDHTSAHIYRSVLEGVAFGIRNIVEMVENAGLTVQDVISVGGGTNNKTWVQIVSDCTGKEQQVLPAQNGAAYGAALLAGKGIGITDNPAEHIKTADAKYRPNQHNRSVYDAAYRKYRNLYEATKLLMHDMKEE